MAIVGGFEEVELDLAEGGAAGLIGEEFVVVLHHEVFGAGVIDFPEADQLTLRSGQDEGTTQAVYTFPIGDIAESGFAGGEHDELSAA
jgi:hypothetical protein